MLNNQSAMSETMKLCHLLPFMSSRNGPIEVYHTSLPSCGFLDGNLRAIYPFSTDSRLPVWTQDKPY